tara:strand:+ start:210 stop:431 length:222 start_codon:yes stop_codon:yes gene_type:complete
MSKISHENLLLDLSTSKKAKLYKDNVLLFLGNGHKAIRLMIENSDNKAPLVKYFRKQLEAAQNKEIKDTKKNE